MRGVEEKEDAEVQFTSLLCLQEMRQEMSESEDSRGVVSELVSERGSECVAFFSASFIT